MKDICCIGHLTHDRIITPKRSLDLAGGTSFYFAHGISHLPQRVSFQLVTKGGEYINQEVECLRKMGVDVTAYKSEHTVFFENKYGTDSNNRQQRVLAKADAFTMDEVKPLEAKVFHLGSLLAHDFPVEVVHYLSTKGRVSIDVQGYLREVRDEKVYPVDWKDKAKVLECTDFLKLNEHEMEVVTSSHDPRSVALELASYGVREVIVTLGSYGSVVYVNGKFYEIPAYKPREVVDATGCGDTYSTGYLYLRLQGADPDEAGRFAAAMCTLKLEHSGPFDAKIEDIRRLIRKNS
ncbi:MAG: PfkB family carbohydrate kinase [Prevotella sp.]|jgi:sugar/nucleoside kinase (ribokinase family)